jgi:hypothetical protein
MRTVLKVVSLLFAIGVLCTLVVRAGIVGCQSQPASSISNDPTAQPQAPVNPTAPAATTTAAATTNAPAMTTAPATAAAPTDTASAPKPKFLPASKAGPVWESPTPQNNAPAKKGQ